MGIPESARSAAQSSMFVLLRGRPLLQAVLTMLLGGAAYPAVGWWWAAAGLVAASAALWTRRTWVALLCLAGAAGGLYAGARAVGAERSGALVESDEKIELVGRVLTMPAAHIGFTSLVMSVEQGPMAQGARVVINTGADFTALPGELLRLQGRIRPVDSRYWRRQGVVARMNASRNSIQRVEHSNRPLAAAIASLRSSAERSYLRQMSPEAAAMTIGIVFGDDGRVPRQTREAMKRAGTYHLLAASGLNVAVVGGLLLGILGILRVPRGLALMAAMLGIAGYTFAAGGTPPTVRAAVALCVYLIAAAVRRQPDALTALAVGAAYSFVADPGVLRDPGFQLSYLVAAALIVWCPPGFRWLSATLPGNKERLLRQASLWALAGVMTSVVASFAATPLLAFYFQIVPLLGSIANLLSVPLAAPILWGGLLGPVGTILPGWEALWLRGIVAPCADWLADIGSVVANLPWSATSVAGVPTWVLWLFFLVFFGAAREWRREVH